MNHSLVIVKVKDNSLDLFGDCRFAADAINKAGGDAGVVAAFKWENYEKDLEAAKDWAMKEIDSCHPDIAKNLVIEVIEIEDE